MLAQPSLSDVRAGLSDVRTERARRSLSYFVPFLTPSYREPRHLAPLIERLERAVNGERQFVVCHAPPRHAKTETVLHFVSWGLRRNPALTFAYATYADRLARSKSRKAMVLAERAGIRLESKTLNEWRTAEGGGLLAGGIGGPLTGHGLNCAVVDDPVKNRIEAESKTYRERNWDWMNDVLLTRIEPGGSVFVFMTRWHPDDLSGRLIREGWDHICLPAINAAGEALWPERWPVEELERKKKKVGAYTWASLFQGQPRPRGGAVFGESHTYSELPTVYQAGFGVDLAYTSKTSSDFSVAVKMLKANGKKYVVGVLRKQVRAPKFKRYCRRLHRREQGAPWRFYGSGTETGSADFFNEEPRPVPLQILPTKGDKLVRAQHYAAEWNAGNILVPKSAPWLDAFLAEHAGFTGKDGDEDDQVDAAVAANDVLDDGADMEIDERPAIPKRTGLAAQEM